jgi:hypothetical protein
MWNLAGARQRKLFEQSSRYGGGRDARRHWTVEKGRQLKCSLHPYCTFTRFAEPMSAPLADMREFTCPPAALAAFQGHYFSAFLTTFDGVFRGCLAARISLAS